MTLADDFITYIKNYEGGKSGQAATDETISSHKYYGVRNPDMREFLKAWAANNQPNYNEWLAELDKLYEGHSVEERCFAGMVLAKYSTYRRTLPIETLDNWLGQLEGWQEVDSTCQSVFTLADIMADWTAWEQFISGLAKDENINKRRASLVLPILPIRKTDDARILNLVLGNVEMLKHETSTLITKAVSWVLRESVKQHHNSIRDYVEANADSLPAIAVRETRTKLKTGKK